jgi:hypothetical protein
MPLLATAVFRSARRFRDVEVGTRSSEDIV